MGREISLFPNYDSDENRTTNYCLLLLKLFYEENPKFLSEVLDNLINEVNIAIGGTVGVKFTQQQKKGDGIIDGQISQDSLTIRIETKKGDLFDENQLKNHLEALKEVAGSKVLVTLGNIDSQNAKNNTILNCIRELCDKSAVAFAVISFEDFLQALQLEYLPKNLADTVDELAGYFNERGLLSSWKNRLDVVNCARSFDEVMRDKAYTCPAEGGKYSHKRSQYFGTYRNKCVERVALIEALVDLGEDNKTPIVKWKNIEVEDNELIKKARVIHQRFQGIHYPLRVFLLGDLYATNFIKGTPGGMFGVKKYFDVSSLNASDAANLAEKLKDKTWQSYIE